MESAQPALAGDHSEAAPNVKRLAGKVAIVTGAPRSIGRAIAQSLAGDGASIVVRYRSRREEADATVAALRKSGTGATAIGGDLSDSANVAGLFPDTQAAFGGIDISSSSARFAPAGLAAYGTSKAGTDTTIGVLAKELGPRGESRPTRSWPAP